MSRSLAPSPIATVRASGSPSSAANSRSAAAFPARSTTSPTTRPVSRPSRDLEPVGPRVVDAELARRVGSTTSMKPPETTATVKPSRLRVRTRVRAPGVRRTASRTSSSTDAGRPARRGDPGAQALRRSPARRAWRASVTAATSAARPACSASSSMTSSWMSVESTSMTTRRPPAAGQAGRGHGDVGADLVLATMARSLPQVADVGARHVELDGRHGVAGEPPDAVDVGAVVGDRGGDGGDVVGLERGARARTTAARPVRRRRVVTVADLEVDPHPEGRAGAGQPVDEHVLVTPGGQQHRQGEVAADDDLLEVEHLGPDRRRRARRAPWSRRAGPGP